MKRKGTFLLFVMLMAALLLSGCGSSGGGGTAAGSGNNGGIVIGNASDSPGYIVLNFEGGLQRASALRSPSSTLPLPTKARVVIRQLVTYNGIDEFGEPAVITETKYKQIVDVDLAIPGPTTIPVTPGTGYQVDVISYVISALAGDHKSLLKYGNASGINIVSGVSTPVTITAVPFNAGLTVPAAIAAGSTYNVTVNYGGSPLRYEKNLRVTDGDITDLFTYNVSNVSFERTADALATGDPAKTKHFQGLFFLSDDLLNSATESWNDWRYYEPNRAEFGDSEVTSTITPPGGVIINITL
jgi:hypothetical protein